MFSEIRLSNFKSFRGEHKIPLRRLTILVGPNGSGKSSILQIPIICEHSLGQGILQTVSGPLDLGGLSDLYSPPGPLPRIGLTVLESLDLSFLAGDATPVTASAEFDASFGSNPDAGLEIKSKVFNVKYRWQDNTVEPQRYEQDGSYIAFSTSRGLMNSIQISDRGGAKWQDLEKDIQATLSMMGNALKAIRLVPALRGFSAARYVLGQETYNDFAVNTNPTENAVRLATTLTYDNDLRNSVKTVLATLTGVDIDRELIPDKRITVVSRRPSPEAPPKDVVPTNEGFGTNQLIHLVAQTLATPRGGTVLIEEPEIHLHPDAQFKLGRWLGEHVIKADKQLVIATHSERLLVALLWLVRQEVMTPADMVIHYFHLDPKAQTQHHRLDVTHGGLLQGEFKGFFPDPDIPEFTDLLKGLRTSTL
ncbi:MAG: AAA family ATPase [Chloroflexi bacterium]|nr:AAA family ATPase [Chloroflexota bacterium]